MRRAAIRSPEDFWSGVLFAGFGVGFGVMASTYEQGSATKMGPGFFPFVLAVVLALIGLAAAIRAFLRPGPPLVGFACAPMLLVLGAVVAFAALLHGAGLAVALVVVVLVSARPSLHFRWLSAILLAGAVSAVSILVFVYALRLPIPVVGLWLTG